MRVTLKAARVNAGLTIEKAAKAIGVGQTSIRNWESGRSEMRASQLLQLCRLYSVPAEDLILPAASRKLEA